MLALIIGDVVKHSLKDGGRVPGIAQHVVAVHKGKEPGRAGVVLASLLIQHPFGVSKSTLHEAVGLGVVFVQHDGVILILEDAGSLHRWDISKTNQSKVAKNGKVDKAEGQEDPRLIPSSSLLLDLKW